MHTNWLICPVHNVKTAGTWNCTYVLNIHCCSMAILSGRYDIDYNLQNKPEETWFLSCPKLQASEKTFHIIIFLQNQSKVTFCLKVKLFVLYELPKRIRILIFGCYGFGHGHIATVHFPTNGQPSLINVHLKCLPHHHRGYLLTGYKTAVQMVCVGKMPIFT